MFVYLNTFNGGKKDSLRWVSSCPCMCVVGNNFLNEIYFDAARKKKVVGVTEMERDSFKLVALKKVFFRK